MAVDVLDEVLTKLRAPLGSPVVPSQWNGDLDACKEYADRNEVPMIAIWSNDHRAHCEILEKPMLSADNLNQYLDQSKFVLCFTCSRDPLGVRMGDEDGNGKYYHFCKGPQKLTDYPFVRFYWYRKNGTQKLVDYSVVGDVVDGQQGIYQNKYEKAGQNIIDYIEKKSGIGDYDKDGDLHHDIKLLSFGTSTTTSKDAQSESVGLDEGVVLAQSCYEYGELQSDLLQSSWRFYGWNSHCNAHRPTLDIINTPNGRSDALDLVLDAMEKNCRPLFLIYTRAHNKGSNAFNFMFYKNQSSFPSALRSMSTCQMSSFDSSKKDYGFYFLHYQNNGNETDANANRAKAFITQFGKIDTGYPWYIAYCKYPDGHVYARYGSLYSMNYSMSQIYWSSDNSIYTKFEDAAKEFGTEIAYVYNEKSDDPDIDYKIFHVNFSSGAGASGTVDPIQVTVDNLHDYKGTARLPTKDQVASKVKKSGYEPAGLKSSSGKSYAFGTQIEVTGSIMLEIVWVAAKNDDGGSTSPKKTIKSEKIRSYEKRAFPVWYKYGSTGNKTAQFSSNVSALQVIGEASGGPARNSASQQLVEAYFNDSISEIAPSAFMGCQNLAYVSAKSIKSVGDYAFYNCKSLTAAEFIGAQNKALTHIGDYAFAGSGIKDLVINLQGSVSDSSTNSHCFANCRELTSVNITNSTYLADHMFDGCTKLQQITLNNYHSYINDYAFANCTMLTSMTLPQKTYMLPDHFFDGCTNLREVKFDEPSDLKYLGSSVFANCPKLTSITLPKSVDSLEYIDPLFLQGSSVDRIVFRGIGDDILSQEAKAKKEIPIQTGKMHVTGFANLWKCGIDNNVPMVLCLTKGDGHGCGFCNSWASLVRQYTSQIAKTSYLWFSGQYIDNPNEYNALEKQMSELGFSVPGTWIFLYLYWKKEDGSVVSWHPGHVDPGSPSIEKFWTDVLKKTIDSKFSGYVGPETIIYVINENLTTFGRGRDVAVTFVSSTGKEYVCKNDSVVYTPETRVDHYSTSDFKYGIWYGNIRELRAFADENHLPLLLEFGSRGCDPCKDFKKNTFNNQDFQEQIAQKPCLLAKVEIGDGQSFDYPTDTQEFYASHEIGDPKTYIPQLVYYWNKEDGTTYKEIWNYNYRSDPGNANYQTVLNKLEHMLGSYAGDPQYIAPIVESQLDGKYRYYRSESEDSTGQFFICDKKTMTRNFSQPDTQLSIVLERSTLSAGVTLVLDSIGVGDELVLSALSAADGAYQYFTVGESSRYFDLSGVVFTVQDSTVTNLYTFENDIGSTYAADYEYTDAGHWIAFNDNSTRESFEAKLDAYRSSSTPILIYERAPTVGAVATFAPRSGGEEQTQTIQIDIESAKSQGDIEAKVRESIGPDNALSCISNIDDLVKLQTFNTQVKHNAAFLTWAKKKNLVLLDVASSSWSSGAPARIRQFESEVQFHGNSTTDPLPKMLVYHGCSTCTVDGSIAVYTRRKVEVDASKSLSYYTGLIGEYLSELEVS